MTRECPACGHQRPSLEFLWSCKWRLTPDAEGDDPTPCDVPDCDGGYGGVCPVFDCFPHIRVGCVDCVTCPIRIRAASCV